MHTIARKKTLKPLSRYYRVLNDPVNLNKSVNLSSP